MTEQKKQKQIEELRALMLEKSNLANLENITLTDKNGDEYYLPDEITVVVKAVIEKAFISLISEIVINAGYGDIKQAVREFAEKVKRSATPLGRIWVEDMDELVKETCGE